MALSLTEMKISPVKGNAALLPNQPILQGCVVGGEAALVAGDVVALTTGGVNETMVVKKAAVTEEPIGVVVGNPIKSQWQVGERVSVFPHNSYVYMEAGATNIARGAKLQFTADGKVAATTTSTNAYIGHAMTTTTAVGDLLVVHVRPSK